MERYYVYAKEHGSIYFVYGKATAYFTKYYTTYVLSIYFGLTPVW